MNVCYTEASLDLWCSFLKGLGIHEKEGVWFADWPELEDYEMGPASIAWTMWNIIRE